jgi:glycosyltransferase involved in cell wall biosynthesis
MVYQICRGLVERGHQVELFASGDSRTPAALNAVVEKATLLDPDSTLYLDKEYEARNAWSLYARAGEFDIIHGHWPCLAPYFSDRSRTPTVLTYAYVEPHLHRFYRENFPSLRPVCISRNQAESLGEPDLPVIYNGIDLETVPFQEGPGEGFVIAGRIVPNKGIAEAIEVARRLGERLLIVGDTTPCLPWSEPYWRERVEPYVDGDAVRHVRHMENRELVRAMGKGRAFLFPLQWEEPFGLVVAESMAAGTPVLALRRGSMPELVEDGVTGFLGETLDDLVDAARGLDRIDRAACRRRVEERFSVAKMVEGYEILYRRILEGGTG